MLLDLNLLDLRSYPILDQLELEEALLRADNRNWCVINQAPPQAIVLGISSQMEQLIDLEKIPNETVQVIRRFSGGGTVFIDHNCYMVSFICNSDELQVPCFPQHVFRWSELFYQQVFHNIDFTLRENDYVSGQRKFGGNAQYMTKNRWLHHTSFLWDYDSANMSCLKMPVKIPEYREKRGHDEFLCKLKDLMDSQENLHHRVLTALKSHFKVTDIGLDKVLSIKALPHRKATKRLL